MFVTLLVTLQKKVCTQFLKSGPKLSLSRALKRKFYSIESNAFSKSRKIQKIASPGRFFAGGVANNITNEPYVFTDIPSFDIECVHCHAIKNKIKNYATNKVKKL